MAQGRIITGIDIGTDTVKVLSVRKSKNQDSFESLFCDKINSFGVQKGRVKDPLELSKKILSLVEKAEGVHGEKIENVFANINGFKLKLIPNHGLISVARADQKVSKEDVDRILQETQNINLSSNQEIIDIFPKEWILDGEKDIRDPEGLKGVRLELEALLLSGFTPDIESVNEAISQAGIQSDDVIPSPVAVSKAVLSGRQKELGVAIVDIGAGTSSVSIFEDGALLNLAVFPLGSANITNDIAIGLKTEIDIAEKIKREYGYCFAKTKNSKKKISIENKNEKKLAINFSEAQLKKIIDARVMEILECVAKELKKVGRNQLLPAGIVLTGGGAKLPGIIEMSKKELKLPCRTGESKKFLGIDDFCIYNTVCGIIMEGLENEGESHVSFNKNSFGSRLKKIFRIFIP